MKKTLLTVIVIVLMVAETMAQPFALATNNVDGSPFTCNLLEDLGIYKRMRVQATQNSSSATWEFPALCSFPGNVWRPYAATAPIPFNAVIPPIPNTAAALYNSGNGGVAGNLLPVTLGHYYTFNVQNIFTPTGSPYIAVLETDNLPVAIQTVTQLPISNAVGENIPVNITITTPSDPVENVFVRYTTDNFVSSSIVQAIFTGTTGTAEIPGLPLGTNVKYYVYSSPKARALIEADVILYGQVVHDMYTLDWNTNIGQNYSYTVTAVLPVKIDYLRGLKQDNNHVISWKANCVNSTSTTFTLERSAGAISYSSIFSIQAGALRCSQPFTYTDTRPLPGANYYRLRMRDNNDIVTYSRVIALLNKTAGLELVSIAPTVVQNNRAILELTAALSQKTELLITDVSGRQMQRLSFQPVAGSNQLILDVSALSPGTYFVTAFSVQGNSGVLKFVKQ